MATYNRNPIDIFRQGRRISKAQDGIALQAANESNKAKEFLKNWYQSPTTKSMFQSNAQAVQSRFDINNGYQDILNEINSKIGSLSLGEPFIVIVSAKAIFEFRRFKGGTVSDFVSIIF